MVNITFKKSKFIALFLVKENYIRLRTIGPYDYTIKGSLKTNLNEKIENTVMDIHE